MLSLRQLCFRRSRTHQQFGAAFFIVAAPRVSAIDFHRDLADPVAVLAQLCLDRIPTLRAIPMFGLELLHLFRAMLHFLGKCVQLRIEFGALLFNRRELAGKYEAQLGAHFVAQARVALGLRRLPLQRIHLPRHFFENVIDAGEIQLGILQAELPPSASSF